MLFKKNDTFLNGSWFAGVILFWGNREWYTIKRNGDIVMKVEGSIQIEPPSFRIID